MAESHPIFYFIRNKKMKTPNIIGLCAGISESAKKYAENIKSNLPRGHGFRFEEEQNKVDQSLGKDTKIVGGNNAKNGADRVVDGVNIQSKCCKTGAKCISECFEGDKFRYLNPDGSLMKIEVPKDKYESAVQAMADRIKKGQVPGVTDPDKAKDIVQEGYFTYKQITNIAKFGTIESLKYDAVNGAKIGTTSMTISTAISFAYAIWSGEEWDVALRRSAWDGVKVGVLSGVSSVGTAQLGRTSIEKSLMGVTDWMTEKLGYKVSSWISKGSGMSISGAAAKSHASKLLRGNVVTGIVCTAVSSIPDYYRCCQGKMSGAQAAKNTATTGSVVATGSVGWVAGAALGSAIPVVGTAFGAIVGGLAGSIVAGQAGGAVASKVLDKLKEDDSVKMMAIAEKEFSMLAVDYLLTQQEANAVKKAFTEIEGVFYDMYASDNREEYARNQLKYLVENLVSMRTVIQLPTAEEFVKASLDATQLVVVQ